MKYVYVLADTNDADYISQLTKLNDEDYDSLVRICKIIKEQSDRHNWQTSEYGKRRPEQMYAGKLSEEDYELMTDYIPYGEYGVHTIIEMKILEVASEEVLV